MALTRLCYLAFIILSCCSLIRPARCDDEAYDFLLLTREWPFTYCTVQSCSNTQLLQNRFNIHGLWAEFADNASVRLDSVPVFCNATFNKTELLPLMEDLQVSWSNLNNPNASAMRFWAYEFIKHGSCVATDYRYNSTYAYFKTALELDAKYNLLDMLKKAGIQPGTKLINSSDIRAALRAAFGFDSGVRCFNQTGRTFLYELRLCFTKELQPMSCGETPGPPPPPPPPPPQWQQDSMEGSGLFHNTFSGLLHRLLGWWWPRALPEPPVRKPQGAGPQQRSSNIRQAAGTYACYEGEMVLMPDSV